LGDDDEAIPWYGRPVSASTAPAGNAAQVAAVLAVPILVFIVGAFALPTPSSMKGAREGTDREALSEVLVKKAPRGAESVDVSLKNTIRIVSAEVNKSPVSPGGKIELTTYFEALKSTDRDWRVFLHIDRRGGPYRIHGDHDPADGRYQTSLWRKGEIIKDAFTKRVPVDAPSGTYDAWLGFYIKNDRMKFSGGDKARHDGDNRIRVGTLTVK
jgi:hypothetical protein